MQYINKEKYNSWKKILMILLLAWKVVLTGIWIHSKNETACIILLGAYFVKKVARRDTNHITL